MPKKGKHVASSQFDVPTSDIDPAYAVFLANLNKLEARGGVVFFSYSCSTFFMVFQFTHLYCLFICRTGLQWNRNF
jgi:hypothetical protein